jgi:hypothetical protein
MKSVVGVEVITIKAGHRMDITDYILFDYGGHCPPYY